MITKGFALAAALAASILISGSDNVQAQTQTCSGLFAQCVQNGKEARGTPGRPGECSAARAACMKTGRWIGPSSGRDYGPAEKK
jgi:hypothetical protein